MAKKKITDLPFIDLKDGDFNVYLNEDKQTLWFAENADEEKGEAILFSVDREEAERLLVQYAVENGASMPDKHTCVMPDGTTYVLVCVTYMKHDDHYALVVMRGVGDKLDD